MGYVPPPSPNKREKELFILGILYGALFSFLGSFVVQSSFRILDKGYTIENVTFLIAPMIIVIFIILLTPNFIRKF